MSSPRSVYGLVGKPDLGAGDVTIVPATYLELKRQQLAKEQPLRCQSAAASPSTPTHFGRSPFGHVHSFSRESSFTQPGHSQPTSPTAFESRSIYANQSQRSSMLSLSEADVHHGPRFYRDTTHLWYKPDIGRDEATRLLKSRPPGSFLVRDSQSFPGSFGLMLRVAELTAEMSRKSHDPSDDLIRHFLIEPTSKGVRIKGCANEPVFGSLSALIYQHSCTQLALPCKLLLPEIEPPMQHQSLQRMHSAPSATVADGAGCNVLYLLTVDTESLTGPQAVKKAVEEFLELTQAQQRTVLDALVKSDAGKEKEKTKEKSKEKTKEKSKEKKEQESKQQPQLEQQKQQELQQKEQQQLQQQQQPFHRAQLGRASSMTANGGPGKPIMVYFKVSSKGITLTDNTHRYGPQARRTAISKMIQVELIHKN